MEKYKLTETRLKEIVMEEFQNVLKEWDDYIPGYDAWKTMTPEEDAGLTDYDVEITIRVSIDADEMENWSDCEKKNIEEDGDGGVTFETTFNDSIWVGRYDEPEDEREKCDECAYEFVKNHGDAAGGYEMIDYEIK